jgi:hypothetical protein
MAVATSGRRGNEEGNRLGKMSGKKASRLGRIEEPHLADQGQNEIMDVGEDSGAVADGEAGAIFFESDIPAVV